MVQNEVEQIIHDMRHRIYLLDSLSRSIKGLERKTMYHSVEQKKAIAKVLGDVTTELDELEAEVHMVKTITKKIGDELKRKIRVVEFDEVNEKINRLSFENRISRSELKESFAHYAKE